MMPVSRFASELPGRARCLVVHPGNPPYLLPVAELVPAEFTSQETVERTRQLLAAVGMVPVLVHREIEGFVFNRLQGALLREAYRLVRDGVASAADIDKVVSYGLGRRWSVIGPFATAELNTRGGLARHATVMGPAYQRMESDRTGEEAWSDELVARVAASVHEDLPPDQWSANVLRRDRALMRLAAAGPRLADERQ
jgi:3-hydroxyacyl-CoA dehydrogenase